VKIKTDTDTAKKAGLDYTPQRGVGRHLAYGIASREKCGRRQTAHAIVSRRLENFGSVHDPLAGPPTCSRHDILIPEHAPDHCADYRAICDHYETQALPHQTDLVGVLTLRFPHHAARHRMWEQARAFLLEKVVGARLLPTVMVLHRPAIAARPHPPHIHALIFLRTLDGPDFGPFDQSLTGPDARATLLAEWDAWASAGLVR